ncbi:YcxB family protein [Kitasatospora sp. NPDC059571]|uniref:YcxB family protein n=1 Tax=Kitasatospora sp. NPDC059571 TaxID=3346871 RepID=UPI0036ACAFA5
MHFRILVYGIAGGLAVMPEPLLRCLARLATTDEHNAPRTFEITQDAFVTIQGGVTRSISWAEMCSVRRRGEWWQFDLTEKQFILFPRRALNINQRSEFEAFLAAKGWTVSAPAS